MVGARSASKENTMMVDALLALFEAALLGDMLSDYGKTCHFSANAANPPLALPMDCLATPGQQPCKVFFTNFRVTPCHAGRFMRCNPSWQSTRLLGLPKKRTAFDESQPAPGEQTRHQLKHAIAPLDPGQHPLHFLRREHHRQPLAPHRLESPGSISSTCAYRNTSAFSAWFCVLAET